MYIYIYISQQCKIFINVIMLLTVQLHLQNATKINVTLCSK